MSMFPFDLISFNFFLWLHFPSGFIHKKLLKKEQCLSCHNYLENCTIRSSSKFVAFIDRGYLFKPNSLLNLVVKIANSCFLFEKQKKGPFAAKKHPQNNHSQSFENTRLTAPKYIFRPWFTCRPCKFVSLWKSQIPYDKENCFCLYFHQIKALLQGIQFLFSRQKVQT